MFMLRSVVMLATGVLLTFAAGGAPAGAESLSLAQAKRMVFERHPGLNALTEEMRSAEEALRQVSALENPEIEIGTERFGRNEVEMVVTQAIPLGGIRGAAIERARLEVETARLKLESERLSVEAELVRRFVAVLGARKRVALLDSLVEVSQEGVAAVSRLVEAGAAMQIDLVRTELERDELLLDRLDMERALVQESTSLARLWGESEFRYESVSGSIDGLLDFPEIDVLVEAVEVHPTSMVFAAEKDIALAELDEVRALRWPELALSAGYLENNESGEGAVLLGASVSLPIFDRKKAAIAAGNHSVMAAEHRRTLGRLERTSALSILYSELQGTRKRLEVLTNEILPKATQIHTDLQDFYARGKVGILDVLEARGHLLEVRMRVLDLVEEQALLGAHILELTGYELEIMR